MILWNIPQNRLLASADRGECGTIAFSRDGNRVATGTLIGGRLYNAAVFAVPDLKPVATLEHPKPAGEPMKHPQISVVGFSADCESLYTVYDTMYRWNLRTGKGTKIGSDDPQFNKFNLSPDARWLFVHRAKVRPRDSLELRSLFGAKSRSIEFPKIPEATRLSSIGSWKWTVDGKRLYGADQINHILYAWSIPDGKLLGSQHVPQLVFFDISGDGKRLVASQREDKAVMAVYDTAANRIVAHLQLESRPNSFAMSPNGRYVAVREDRALRLWDLQAESAAQPN